MERYECITDKSQSEKIATLENVTFQELRDTPLLPIQSTLISKISSEAMTFGFVKEVGEKRNGAAEGFC